MPTADVAARIVQDPAYREALAAALRNPRREDAMRQLLIAYAHDDTNVQAQCVARMILQAAGIDWEPLVH